LSTEKRRRLCINMKGRSQMVACAVAVGAERVGVNGGCGLRGGSIKKHDATHAPCLTDTLCCLICVRAVADGAERVDVHGGCVLRSMTQRTLPDRHPLLSICVRAVADGAEHVDVHGGCVLKSMTQRMLPV